jgi:predicted RNA binding protein YcfA (HicA-like mRNA interferase family)
LTVPSELDGRRFLRALARLGWVVVRQSGSHRILQHGDGRRISVAFHETIRRGAIRNTLRLPSIQEDDFQEAL